MRCRAAGVFLLSVTTATVCAAQTPAKAPDRLLRAGHTGPVQAVGFSADGRWLASDGSDRTAIIWNAATAGEQRRLMDHGRYP